MDKINLNKKFSLFNEYWTPKIIGELNEQYVKLAKAKGEFIWHKHDDEDELFLVIKGSLTIQLRNRDIQLKKGEIFIVPKGLEHKPVALEEVHVLLFEPKATKHTGDVKSEITVEDQEWV
ncbi:MAG: cupin domain-containing protein [Candidatus Aminicenantes bacterium]|nr:MAG: cupin domain-containing protein [Candidatus Aminicenantes bacterium]